MSMVPLIIIIFRGMLQEYGVGSPLLLFKSLYSCSDVCARIGGVKSQWFVVLAGLRLISFFNLLLHRLCQRSPYLARGPDPARVGF